MTYGMIRVGAIAPDLQVGNCPYNTDKLMQAIIAASQKDIHILVFPELCITSYTCGDLFQQRTLLQSAESEFTRLVAFSNDYDMLILVGLPLQVDNQVFNCAVLIHKGRILGAVPKIFIPGNNEFYEERWFASATSVLSDHVKISGKEVPFGTDLLFKDTDFPGLCIGIEICEDLWVPIPPSSFHALHGATIILNPSASNEIVGKNEYRKSLVQQQSARCIAGYIYSSAGQGESTTDVVFSGHGLIGENGTILSESNRFSLNPECIFTEIDIERLLSDRQKLTSFMSIMGENCSLYRNYRFLPFTLNSTLRQKLSRAVDPYPFVPGNQDLRDTRCQEIFTIQMVGLSKRILHTKIEKVIIGISGGLDSTLALLVCVKAFDRLNLNRKNIIGITMPGFGTTDRTYQNALDLMKTLGITIREISIKDACLQHFKDIGHDPSKHDVTYENTQARERTQILMDSANQESGMVVGTGDLSELALGWATYNGDHMSMYAVNTGVPKTLVRFLVSWVADNIVDDASKTTLLDILNTPVSPELLPADEHGNIEQKTEELVGPYELHDFFLYQMVRFGTDPKKIAYLAEIAFQNKYERSIIIKWLKIFYIRFFTQQFKRSCLPDGPKVGSICLSPRGDWRMPSDASYQIWMDRIDSL